MDGNIFRYIQILLPQHQCVTIPGLGAFIVNNEHTSGVRKLGKIMPPSYKLSFNSQLIHDDGVLTSFYQQLKNISYEKASAELTKEFNRLKSRLNTGEELTCGKLGTLILKNGNLTFTLSPSYFLPIVLGLTPVSLLSLEEIYSEQKQKERSNRRVIFRRNIISATTVAALIAVFFFPTNAIHDIDTGIEQANFLHSVSKTIHTPEVKPTVSIGEINETNEVAITDAEEESIANETIKTNIVGKKYYYLVIAGDTSETRANKILENIRKEGFNEAAVITSSNRHRVYIQQFEDKSEADKAVLEIREAYPRYASAWIYSKIMTE